MTGANVYTQESRLTTLWMKKTHTHTHPFNGPFSGTTQVGRYQKGKTNLDFTEARDSEWQWHQLGHMQVCTLLQTDNHASTPPLSFLQAGCPSCRPTNSVKALKENMDEEQFIQYIHINLLYMASQCYIFYHARMIYESCCEVQMLLVRLVRLDSI